MEKKPLALRILVDEKQVRKTAALISGEVLSDQQISDMFDNPIETDLSKELGAEGEAAEIGLIALLLSKKFNM